MVTRSQRDGKDALRGVGCHFLGIGRDDDNRRNRLIPILDFGFGPLHKQQSPYLSLIPDQKVRAIERARSSMVGHPYRGRGTDVFDKLSPDGPSLAQEVTSLNAASLDAKIVEMFETFSA